MSAADEEELEALRWKVTELKARVRPLIDQEVLLGVMTDTADRLDALRDRVAREQMTQMEARLLVIRELKNTARRLRIHAQVPDEGEAA